jgi:hypothetical protein
MSRRENTKSITPTQNPISLEKNRPTPKILRPDLEISCACFLLHKIEGLEGHFLPIRVSFFDSRFHFLTRLLLTNLFLFSELNFWNLFSASHRYSLTFLCHAKTQDAESTVRYRDLRARDSRFPWSYSRQSGMGKYPVPQPQWPNGHLPV